MTPANRPPMPSNRYFDPPEESYDDWIRDVMRYFSARGPMICDVDELPDGDYLEMFNSDWTAEAVWEAVQ